MNPLSATVTRRRPAGHAGVVLAMLCALGGCAENGARNDDDSATTRCRIVCPSTVAGAAAEASAVCPDGNAVCRCPSAADPRMAYCDPLRDVGGGDDGD